jgi:hypothetical protein
VGTPWLPNMCLNMFVHQNIIKSWFLSNFCLYFYV